MSSLGCASSSSPTWLTLAFPGLSPDRTFATAYNAVLQLSKLALACAGYRVSAAVPGHHQTTFEAAGLVLGAGGRHFTDYFETCRRKRNVIDYDSAEVVSESQAAELFAKATQYHALVETESQRTTRIM